MMKPPISVIPVVLLLLLTAFAGAGVAPAQDGLVPPPPTGIRVVNGPNPGEASVSWNPVAGVSNYRVGWLAVPDYEANRDNNRWRQRIAYVDVNAGSSHTVTRLTPGIEYYFIVGSRHDGGRVSWPDFWVRFALRDAASACPATGGVSQQSYSEVVDGYLVTAPEVFRSGRTENVAVSLFHGSEPAQGPVRLTLMQGARPVSEAVQCVVGAVSIPLRVPALSPGRYDLRIEGGNRDFVDTAAVRVKEPAGLLFLETDKPIYKPGQEIRIRILQLDADLKPLPGPVEVSVLDATGIKVHKATVDADEFGMAETSLTLSTEPNLGLWKISAGLEGRDTHPDIPSAPGGWKAQLDVRVEEYVLPKYEVSVDLAKEWVLADEPVTGAVSAEYSFGKPVRGEVEVVALRYVGAWEEYARFAGGIDGATSFELPAAGYLADVSAAGGEGNLQLDITVREPATGYEERITRMLTVADAPVNLRLIPESPAFKPGLPFGILIMAETPDRRPVAEDLKVEIEYTGPAFEPVGGEVHTASTGDSGSVLLELHPPAEAVELWVEARSADGYVRWRLSAGYSPSGNFVHVNQTGDTALSSGDRATFRVNSTAEARRFYYEVLARGGVVFSAVTRSPEIAFEVTANMAPEARLVVYQVLPSDEVAADFIPFTVGAVYPMAVDIAFSSDEVRPGDAVDISVNTAGPAKVGLAAVDRSVFILAENRLNLQQVFAELERLYALPRAEVPSWDFFHVKTRGAAETFDAAGLVVMTDKSVPTGAEFYWTPTGVPAPTSPAVAAAPAQSGEPDGLAEVQRVRQFFPETWLWTDVMTSETGWAVIPAKAPDSITTWNLRAVGVSPEHGLGIANTELAVFQPFFLQIDLPYSAIRGEEFPIRVALYNYLDTPQEFHVELEKSTDFALLGDAMHSITVAANEVGGVAFNVRLTELGSLPIKVTARSAAAADAVIRYLLVEPEGVAQEVVRNAMLAPGDRLDFDLAPPPGAIPGSDRAHVALTGSYLAQTLEGLEDLLRMPYGCGEQNMVLFAPNIYVARYLEATGQSKPEINAKARQLMQTGYQRELTYRRDDGSFSAFGRSDPKGSLWLTAFVLKSFAQADGLIYVDERVLEEASDWILSHRRSDGSFEPVGFVHDRGLLGGLRGNTALTAYVAIALHEAGANDANAPSIAYLESRLDDIDDAYTMAIVAYALELAGSPRAAAASRMLLNMAVADDGGLHWSGPASVETTGYALLALLERGDALNAASVARWLATQRNAFGGYGSTQDTVVGLQGLIEYATQAKFDVDMTVDLAAGDWSRQVAINADNADVVQIVELPSSAGVSVTASGSGLVIAQVVHRFNLPAVKLPEIEMFEIEVAYSADHVAVDDIIEITARFAFTPSESDGAQPDAGMVVLDVGTPTGFVPIIETVERLVTEHERVKRYEIAGRKVIVYLEDLPVGEELELRFDAQAQYPVLARAATSQVYSYYNPPWRGETLGVSVTVFGN